MLCFCVHIQTLIISLEKLIPFVVAETLLTHHLIYFISSLKYFRVRFRRTRNVLLLHSLRV